MGFLNKRVGVVGFGKMGMLQGALANSIEGMTLSAICEKSLLLAFGIKTIKKDVKVFSDYKKMIDKSSLDAVIITTPTFNHFDAASYAIQNGISVFIEKPVTRTYDEAHRLYDMAKNLDISAYVGFSYRHMPSIKKGKEILDNEELGHIKSVRASIYSSDILAESNGWRFHPQMSGGGVLIDFGIHMIDMLYWYFGQIESLHARKRKIFSRLVEDEVSAEIVFSNGLSCEMETSWSREEYRKPYPLLVIEGDEATLKVTDHIVELTKNGSTTILTEPDLYQGSFVDIGGIAYSTQMQDFCNSILFQTKDKNGLKEALYVQRIIDSMYTSSQENITILIPNE